MQVLFQWDGLKFLRASCISFVILGLGDSACFTVLLLVSACSESRVFMADSPLATISVAGMLAGVTAKFNPFSSNDTSVAEGPC